MLSQDIKDAADALEVELAFGATITPIIQQRLIVLLRHWHIRARELESGSKVGQTTTRVPFRPAIVGGTDMHPVQRVTRSGGQKK